MDQSESRSEILKNVIDVQKNLKSQLLALSQLKNEFKQNMDPQNYSQVTRKDLVHLERKLQSKYKQEMARMKNHYQELISSLKTKHQRQLKDKEEYINLLQTISMEVSKADEQEPEVGEQSGLRSIRRGSNKGAFLFR